MNTVPRTISGEPVEQAADASKRLDGSSPADDDATTEAEEKKDQDATDAPEPHHSATNITNLEVSLAYDGHAPAVGDFVNTAYGKGKIISTNKESESVEVELPYGRLFVRLTDTIVKSTGEGSASANETPAVECHSGIWLFTDRENITHFFKPNFLPPYNTPEKKKIILDVLREEWDEKTLSWKPCGQGSMTKPKEAVKPTMSDSSPLSALEELMDDIVTTINGCCTPQAKATTNERPNS